MSLVSSANDVPRAKHGNMYLQRIKDYGKVILDSL